MTQNLRLLVKRREKKLTQVELAELAGTTHLRISKFECGWAYPSLEEKQRISEVLNVPAFELFM